MMPVHEAMTKCDFNAFRERPDLPELVVAQSSPQPELAEPGDGRRDDEFLDIRQLPFRFDGTHENRERPNPILYQESSRQFFSIWPEGHAEPALVPARGPRPIFYATTRVLEYRSHTHALGSPR